MIDTDLKDVFKAALEEIEIESESPLRQLTRKILNIERKFLYSDQGSNQRRKDIKEHIEIARKSESFKESQG
ncbi:hypothetical protein B9T23_00025 [Acinetobacter terrae]|uniref:hypothetical protein n=1 Tax=Acinetobacter terrae TaxID=2731247 RepID=UPI000A352CD5|nr:hypothetical protein [Acinetobacter terrae]OTG78522.1 hypothetical protein B9T23_00025 [Acinetobacter terrae]